MKRRLNVTVVMDSGTIPPGDRDFTASVQHCTEGHVVAALRKLAHAVRTLGVDYDVPPIVRELQEHPPDVVFNLTEQFANDRRLDSHVAALLEMMRVPFTGSGPAGLMLCRDKVVCNQLLRLHRIGVPQLAMFPPGRLPRPPRGLGYPMVVKPVGEDGSDGISLPSLVEDAAALAKRVRFVHDRFHQVAVAEEYVPGRELYAGVLGNRRLTVLPPREIRFGAAGKGGPVIATSRVKWSPAYRRKWKIEYGFAELPRETLTRIARLCRRVFRILQVRDYARVDLRLTPEGRLVVLEVNPNPDLGEGDDFAQAARKAGLEYPRLIARILRLALRRYGAERNEAMGTRQ